MSDGYRPRGRGRRLILIDRDRRLLSSSSSGDGYALHVPRRAFAFATVAALFIATCNSTPQSSGAGGRAAQTATATVNAVRLISNITALPANLPGPNTSAYDALKVESQAA